MMKSKSQIGKFEDDSRTFKAEQEAISQKTSKIEMSILRIQNEVIPLSFRLDDMLKSVPHGSADEVVSLWNKL